MSTCAVVQVDVPRFHADCCGTFLTAEANSVPEFLKQLAKLAIKANRIQSLTQDNELAQLLAEAEQRFG